LGLYELKRKSKVRCEITETECREEARDVIKEENENHRAKKRPIRMSSLFTTDKYK
jgi:hypothetical protein